MGRMLLLSVLLVALLSAQAHAKFVFAHFMTSNAFNYTLADWADDIKLAQEAKIQAFALNTARNQGDDPQYALAFQAAASAGFQLAFSFDYAGNGPWLKEEVIAILKKYGSNSAHYKYNGKPWVSTFEGPKEAADWIDIKVATNCFLVPSWSSMGAKDAATAAGGVADGLFSWAAWPWGNQPMNTFIDASYRDYLKGKPYLMPVSPWFYTNLPGYDKNWLWKGDSLWADRWRQILYVQPEWVEIITWNDYGESHHIGPIRDKALGAMRTGKAPIDYVTGMPHDAWRLTLPVAIDMYVRNTTTVTKELVTYWYRIQPGAACNDGRTSGNTASQLQVEFPVTQVLEDKVFFTAVLGSIADVSVSIGGTSSAAKWTNVPDGNGAGLYHGSVPFNGRLGAVVVTITRNGVTIATGTGKSISTTCGVNGLANWNAWVGSASSAATISAAPLSMSTQVCINGTSVPEFSGLCSFGCGLGYCPLGACLCTAMGTQRKKPTAKNIEAYPVAGLNDNYSGLCQFDCALDYCPTGVCTTVKAPLSTPTVSPFLPNACTSGKSKNGDFPGLCGYACGYGFCPIGICECSTRGALGITPPVIDGRSGAPPSGVYDFGICKWSCERGYCPSPCTEIRAGTHPTILVDTAIWGAVATAAPVVSCIPPCVLVLPPYKLSTPTTINFPPVTKTITQMWELQVSTVVVVTITFSPVVTDKIPVGNINITESTLDSITYGVTPSIFPTGYITFTPTSGGKVQKSTIIPYISTPSGTNIWPPIIGKPTRVSFTSRGPPGPTCASDCGSVCSSFCWACGLSCIFGFTSDGHSIKPGNCVGPWCLRGTILGGNIVNDKCDVLATARVCTELISSTAVRTTPTTSWSSTTRTYCRTTVDCDVRDSTTTRTITTSEEPDPTVTSAPLSERFDMNDYKDRDLSGISRDFVEWLAIAEVRISTVFITTTLQPTTKLVTSTVIVRAETKASCGLWNEGWGWSFEVFNIENWSLDGGRSLEKEMRGCGAMTGWTWHDRTTDSFPSVNFNLPYFIRAGCVERAIVSAGGPKISCSKNGWGGLRRDLDDEIQETGVQIEQQKAGADLREDPQDVELGFNALSKRVYTASATRPNITSIPNYVYTVDTASPTYEAMTWNANDNGTVVLIYTSEQFASVQTITSYVPLTATNTNATLPGTSTSGSTAPGTWAVTTTHSAPTQCAASRLTMMIYSQYEIWNNAIIPVPTSTVASCFPSQFASSVIARASGTVLPAFSKLVCPVDWNTHWFNSTYIACCPRNFLLGLPAVRTVGRPGLDATCYSTISQGATVTLTSYGASTLLTTTPFVIPSAGFNAFANAFDGIAANPSPASADPSNTIVLKQQRGPIQTDMVLTG